MSEATATSSSSVDRWLPAVTCLMSARVVAQILPISWISTAAWGSWRAVS